MSYLRDKLDTSPDIKLEPWRQVLLAAAKYIRVHGHCVGRSSDEQGRMCMIGAIQHVALIGKTGFEVAYEAHFNLQRHLYNHHPVAFSCIVDFNDRHSAADVIQALEAAARS